MTPAAAECDWSGQPREGRLKRSPDSTTRKLESSRAIVLLGCKTMVKSRPNPMEIGKSNSRRFA